MNLPLTLPDWVPWWVPLALLVPGLLYALAFLFMPFSVLGVKARLEVIEARLDEVQHELRHLSLRLPAAPRELDFEDVYAPMPRAPRRPDSLSERPPIPPAAQDLYGDGNPMERMPRPPIVRPEPRQDSPAVRPQRSEPRLDRSR